MTIKREWVEVMKEECPEAFTPEPPFRCRCAFIDGMPLLMKSSTVDRWCDLVQFNFGNAVKRFFRQGAEVVVLGFDVYSLVPLAKSITQANRSKKAVPCDFREGNQLPTCIPAEYNDFMRNRAFKKRVIQMVVETLAGFLGLKSGQELIIDYESCPIRFALNPSTGMVEQTFILDMPPMGECDIKCTRWFRRYGDGVAHSVDGDFIPIALMEHESYLRRMDGGMGAVSRPPKMAIFRLEFGAGPSDDGGGEMVAGVKRSANGAKVVRRGRPMEYVNIPLLYESMFMAIRQCAANGINSRTSHDTRYMELLACLIGLTGTDFTRNLPLVGVKKLWGMLSDRAVWTGLVQAFDPDALLLDCEGACDGLVARMYRESYRRHISGVPSSLTGVLDALAKCQKLSERTRKLLPSSGRVATTVKNINWLLQYWRCGEPVRDCPDEDWCYDQACPNPISDEYGFAMSTDRKRAVIWLDELRG